MKKKIVGTCLCIALASLMGFGRTEKVLAADEKGDTYSAQQTAELADGEDAYPAVTFDSEHISIHAEVLQNTVSGYIFMNGVSLYFPFTERSTSDLRYEIYRSTSAKGKYTVIDSGTYLAGTGAVAKTDYKVEIGKTYYYKVKVSAGNDMSDPSAVVSKVKGYKYTSGTVDFELERGSKGVDITICNGGWGANNRFDVYRSTSANKGFKRIKTLYRRTYTDTNVKTGRIYYYKIVPRYYDHVRGKFYTGVTTKAQGIRIGMGNPGTYRAVQNSHTSVKLTWGRVPGANMYEVWYRRTDVSGDYYVKAGVTKSTAFVVKGLTTGGSYRFKLRTQMVSKGRVIGENSQIADVRMGYTAEAANLTATPVGTTLGRDKKTRVVHTDLRWDIVWGSSGYKIMAANRTTGAIVNVATITSGRKNYYRFRNPGTVTGGLKYDYVWVVPYRGKALGKYGSEVPVYKIPPVKDVKVTRKSDAEARIAWKAVPGATSYYVYRRNEQTGMVTWLGDTSVTRFDDQYMTTRTIYTYFVFADMGVDGIEGIKSFEFPAKGTQYEHKIGATRITGASNTAAGKITLKWKYVSKSKCYLVYRATSRKGRYTRIGTTIKNTFVDKKAARGKTYYYKVVTYAVNDAGVASKSACSNTAAVKSVKK